MRCRRRRAGVSTLEIQVALVVLGIALCGLCPLIVMQMKLLRRIEGRTPSLVILHHTRTDALVRQLGGIAATTDDSEFEPALASASTSGATKNQVEVIEVSSSDLKATASFSARVLVKRP